MPRDDKSGLGHEHTDNVELEQSLEKDIDDDAEFDQQEQAVPNTSVAEAARRRRTVEKPEELEQEDLELREYTDAVPPPPPPPQAVGGGGRARIKPRDMTTADEPEGDGGESDGKGGAKTAPTDEHVEAIKGEEWMSRNGPPAPPESSRVNMSGSWLARDD